MRLLAGLMLPTAGQVTVCGYDTPAGTSHLRHAVSYMPQRFGLYEDLTVAENLRSVRRPARRDRRRARRGLPAAVGVHRLAPFTDRLAGKLSGGMKQKLGLACALIHTPRLLLLDEPSVGVDPISRRELWQMVYELVDEGIGVVWSTAYLDEAERCATGAAAQRRTAALLGPPKELTARVDRPQFPGAESGPRAAASAWPASIKRPTSSTP